MTDNKQIEWEEAACDFCKGKNLRILLKDVGYWEHDYKFNVVRCSRCGLTFLLPRPKSKYISGFYKSENYWGDDVNAKSRKFDIEHERERIFSPVYKLIDQRKGRILDIGSGTGLFLTKFKEDEWAIDGVEFSKDAATYAKKAYGITTKIGDFLALSSMFKQNSFDYAVINNVLEHLYKPYETLRAIHGVLKTSGKLIIVVPNIDSLGFKLFKKNWYPLQPPIHLYYFDQKTLRKMLSESGFRINTVSYSYYLHNYFAIFESFRSLLTGRNYSSNKTKIIFEEKDTKLRTKITSVFLKKLAVICIKFLSFLFVRIGSVLGRGEYILLVATKT